MKVTQQLIDQLVDYKLDKGITNAELANRLEISRAHMGRLITPGTINSIGDDLWDNIKRLLGIEQPASASTAVASRDIMQVEYKGKAMEPVIATGQILMAEPMLITKLVADDVVVCRYMEGKSEKTVIRYFKRVSNGIELSSENHKTKTIHVHISKIEWIARIMRPINSIKVGD